MFQLRFSLVLFRERLELDVRAGWQKQMSAANKCVPICLVAFMVWLFGFLGFVFDIQKYSIVRSSWLTKGRSIERPIGVAKRIERLHRTMIDSG